ncbi:tail length tape measure protein [Corynebacterium phage phi674]|uniref:Putative tape measure protein n=1 Tax=Corynebacterium phage phi674 TaxID=2052822 RepID=A0A2H4PIX3_9CAUD|nr:tail length tape measure protein [Corynebacterium phage phi674]ATW62932.1 putative tape measure protein [Corynebacterium phage phi674]
MQDQDTVFVPVLPSFDGFFNNLSKTSKKAGADAGKELSDALAAGVAKSGKAVESAASQMEKAQNRAATAAENTRQKNMALERVMENQNATALDLAKATDAVNKALRDQEASDKAAERAVKNHAKATEEHQRAQDQANDSIREGTSNVDAYSSGLGDLGGSLKNIIGMTAGIGTVGAAISSALDVSSAVGNMNRQLGLTGDAATLAGDQVRETLRTGLAGSADEAAEAIGSLNSQWKYLGSEGEQTAAELADNFLGFTRTFGVDMAEATQTAGQLITSGLATDVESAADMMTTAMQRVPAQMRDELPEIINEYGVNFQNLGFSGEEAFSLLVSASERGKWALDKTGDALKEFTIRGSDMSKTSVEAYDALGLSAEDMSRAITVGGDEAKNALQTVATELLGMDDPVERSNTAIALFGTQLEDIGIEQVPAFLESLTGAENSMEGFAGSSQAVADDIQNSLQGRLDSLKGTATSLASDGFMKAWDAGEQLASWARDSKGWLMPVAIGVGSIAAGMAAWNATMAAGGIISAIKSLTLVTKAQAAAQFLLNGAMWANPVTWVVAGIVALVAGLTYFFTQTETGKAVWEKFTTALGDGWDWLTEKLGTGWDWINEKVFTPLGDVLADIREWWSSTWDGIKSSWDTFTSAIQSGYENYIKPAWDALVTAAQWVALVVGTILITPMMLAWNVLSWAIKAGYENIIKPAWDALAGAAQYLWNEVLSPVLTWIGDKWNQLTFLMQAAWYYIQANVFAPLQAGMQYLWDSVISPIIDWIQNKWNQLSLLMQAAWNYIKTEVFDRFQAGLQYLWDNVVSPVLTWIGDKWDAMGKGLQSVWQWVDSNVFTPLKNGLTTLQNWFDKTVDNIGKGWSLIKDKVKEPIQWVVSVVFNKGIRPAWNSVAKLVGMDDKQLDEIHFADGGTLPGFSPGVDDYRFVDPKRGMAINLGGGESIMRPEWTRAVGGAPAVRAMNDAAKYGGVSGVQRMLGEGASFADGGTIDSNIERTLSALQSEHGKPYQYGGVGNPSWDCSGLWSGIVQSLNGGNLFGGRIFNTESDFSQFGFVPGLSGRVTIGVHNGGGGANSHMAGTIDGINLESGSSNGVQIGGAAIGSDAASLPTRYTLAKFLGEFVSGGNGGGGGNPIASIAKRAWDAVMDLLPSTPEFPGPIGEFPGAAKDLMVNTVWDFVKSKLPFGGGGGYNGPVGAGVEQWRPLVESILDAKGFDKSATQSVLRRMDQESGGNPSAINNWDSNAAAGTPSKGLMQVIDPTFAAHMDPGYTNIWDPESNIRASMNYAVARYGSLSAAYDRAGGYDSGGWVFPGKTLVNNESGVPEAVLTGGQWAKFYELVDSVLPGLSNTIDGMVGELHQAYLGSDAGYGHTAELLGGNYQVAEAMVNASAALGRAERGFNEWARENEDHGRIGTPEEWAQHYGAIAAQGLATDALGLLGLEGLADVTLSDSTVDLLNALGHPASADMFQPKSILDDDNRVAKTVQESVSDTVTDSVTEAVATTDSATDGTTTTVGSKSVVTVQVPAGKTAFTADEVRETFTTINSKVGDIEVRLETVEDGQASGIDTGITMMV